MFKKLLVPLSFILLAANSCKKSQDYTPDPNNTTAPVACNQRPAKVGTVYTYQSASGTSYTLTGQKDTSIGGLNYVKLVASLSSPASYIAVDATGNVWQAVYYNGGDLTPVPMIFIKTGQPVGTTWQYNYSSISAPGVVTYKYVMTILSSTLTTTVAGKTYTNGYKVKTDLQTYMSGSLVGSNATASLYFCGLGIAGTEINGTVSSTLTNFVY